MRVTRRHPRPTIRQRRRAMRRLDAEANMWARRAGVIRRQLEADPNNDDLRRRLERAEAAWVSADADWSIAASRVREPRRVIRTVPRRRLDKPERMS